MLFLVPGQKACYTHPNSSTTKLRRTFVQRDERTVHLVLFVSETPASVYHVASFDAVEDM